MRGRRRAACDGARHGGLRWLAATTALALVASGCAWIVRPPSHPGGPGSAVQILTPAPGTQAATDGEVPVEVRLAANAHATSLRAWLHTGLPTAGRVVDVSDRFTVRHRQATATLTAADLEPGLTRLVVSVRLRWRLLPRVATTTFSWEPDILVEPGCDFLAPVRCLLPFPSDHLTVPDARTDTGRRIAFGPETLPANAAGTHVDPTEWNRNDGFSPGAPALVQVPGLDLAQTGAAPITDIERSLDHDSPIAVIDAASGERHLQWAELDANAETEAGRSLIVLPAVNYEEGRRYVVAMRRLRNADGELLDAPRAFEVYRDRIPTNIPEVEARRPRMERLFAELRRAGIPRHDLYLAWDFTVASARSLAGRMLHIRDDAFAHLGDAAPEFVVTSVEDDVDDRIWRRVAGTYQVPSYLTGDGAPGSRFDYGGSDDPDGLPVRGGEVTAPFLCNIPRSVSEGDSVTPGRGAVYGHGLLGSHTEVNAGNVRSMANEHAMVYCATDWAGFAAGDIGVAVQTLQDFSNFPKIADRTQQGFLNQLFLARLVRDPDGFASDAAFRAGPAATPVLAADQVFYDGNSQGGILGGALTAVSTEFTRAVLGVPGMNYSTLLPRSVDFDLYKTIYEPAYPDELDRAIALAAVQMLWDRSEANGYAHHMTDDPYPGTPAHQVLLHEAFGDHQVANVTTEIMARTIGAHLVTPALAPGRHSDVDPFFGIPAVPGYPFDGSALVVWDSGNPHPPIANVPPRPPEYGDDPHARPRSQETARLQKSEFLRTDGVLVDVCGRSPCLAP